MPSGQVSVEAVCSGTSLGSDWHTPIRCLIANLVCGTGAAIQLGTTTVTHRATIGAQGVAGLGFAPALVRRAATAAGLGRRAFATHQLMTTFIVDGATVGVRLAATATGRAARVDACASGNAAQAPIDVAPGPAATGNGQGAEHDKSDAAPVVFGGAAVAHVSHRSGDIHLGAWLTAEYRLPFDVERSDFPSTAQTVALRAAPCIDIYHRRPWSVGMAFGGGLDIFRVNHSFRKDGELPEHSSNTKIVTVVATLAVLRVRLAQNVHLTSLAGIESDLARPALDDEQGHQRPTTLWPLHPSLMLGLTFTPLGAEPFE
jgi:hypothetical protein